MTPKLPRLPFVLLGLMTIFSFGGPVAIGLVLRGGASRNWPPDRSVEWVTLLGISGVVLALMLACLSLALANRKEMARVSEAAKARRTGVKP